MEYRSRLMGKALSYLRLCNNDILYLKRERLQLLAYQWSQENSVFQKMGGSAWSCCGVVMTSRKGKGHSWVTWMVTLALLAMPFTGCASPWAGIQHSWLKCLGSTARIYFPDPTVLPWTGICISYFLASQDYFSLNLYTI